MSFGGGAFPLSIPGTRWRVNSILGCRLSQAHTGPKESSDDSHPSLHVFHLRFQIWQIRDAAGPSLKPGPTETIRHNNLLLL